MRCVKLRLVSCLGGSFHMGSISPSIFLLLFKIVMEVSMWYKYKLLISMQNTESSHAFLNLKIYLTSSLVTQNRFFVV